MDTHKDPHSAAVLNATGGVITALEVTASEAGTGDCWRWRIDKRLVGEPGRYSDVAG
jgi:hypothetical protein